MEEARGYNGAPGMTIDHCVEALRQWRVISTLFISSIETGPCHVTGAGPEEPDPGPRCKY